MPLLMPDAQLEESSQLRHFNLHSEGSEGEVSGRGCCDGFISGGRSGAYHEFVKLSLFETVRVVFQFDLVRFAPLAVDLQEHLGICAGPLQVRCPNPQGPLVLWSGRRVDFIRIQFQVTFLSEANDKKATCNIFQ